jgi:hypothetical protein
MTLTIDLPPDLENRLEQEAGKRGLHPGEYARLLIEENLPHLETVGGELWYTLTPEEWIREFEAWAESHRDWPVLPPEAYERASFYEGRE